MPICFQSISCCIGFFLLSYFQVQRIITSVGNQDTNGLMEKSIPKSDTAELPAPDPNNPFYFPDFVLPSGLLFNGVRVMKCPVKDDPMTHLKKIYDLPMRDDDIIITAYPKCGEFIDPKSILSYGKVIQYA